MASITQSNVINIVYSDTVLPLKEVGLVVTPIENVNEYDLQNCLNTIFKSNLNVVFKTVSYSKNDQKLYFYSNKNISTEQWDKRNIKTYKPLSSSNEILEEIENVLNPPVIDPNGNYVCIPWDVTKDSSCISVYDILELIKSYKDKISQIGKDFKSSFYICSSLKLASDSRVVIYDFNYDEQELRLGINEGKKLFDYKDVIFSKKDGDLYLKSDETLRGYGKDLLFILGNELSELYDNLALLSNYASKNWFNILSVNSNFYISIFRDNKILISTRKFPNESDFQFDYSFIANEYSCDCNSLAVLNAVKGHEEELFKSIYLEIDKCPKWSQEELYEIRKKQLLPPKEEPKEEIKEETKEEPKTKKLTLFQKISTYFKQ